MSRLLEVKGLETRFFTQDGVVHAVNGITYHLDEGETLAIVGESGCGKSVGVMSLLRLIPMPPGRVTAGEVWFGTGEDRKDLLKISAEAIRQVRGNQIAMIFQDPMTSLNPVLTIGFQISEALMLHLGMDKEAARKRSVELLELVGIPRAADRLDDYPHQFSGGMRQRAMIAMALACNPQIVIADEPTTALDVMIQAQILELLGKLRERLGLAILFVTHDLGVVAEMCDTVLVMYGGVVVEYADVDTIFNHPRHPYTQELLKAFPDLTRPGEKLAAIPGYPPRLNALPPGCRFAPRCPAVMDRCHTDSPPLYMVGRRHYAGCHLLEENPALTRPKE
jgi:oligopeptide transport system ATP-binding protein